jgi:hypothetical protein
MHAGLYVQMGVGCQGHVAKLRNTLASGRWLGTGSKHASTCMTMYADIDRRPIQRNIMIHEYMHASISKHQHNS